MISRRRFIQAGAAISLIGSVGSAAAQTLASTVRSQPFHTVFYDANHPAASAFAAAARSKMSRVEAMGETLSRALWGQLDDFWKKGGGVIAGMTDAQAAYCVETLARNKGMRAYFRMVHTPQADHGYCHRADVAIERHGVVVAADQSDWGERVFDLMQDIDLATAQPVPPLQYAPMIHCERFGPALISWVIAPASSHVRSLG
jgi:hypothetical protein